MKLLPVLLLSGCAFLAACGGNELQKAVLAGQSTFNRAAAMENKYAAQPFCGSTGASTTPGACADPHVVLDMAEASKGAQEVLDGGKAAAENPDLSSEDAATMAAAVVGEIGKFAAIVAKYTAGLAQ